MPGPTALAAIGADTVTVPNASTPLPSPANPDGVAVGALNLAKGGELIVAPGANVGSGYYNLPSRYSPSTSTFTIEGVAPSNNAGTVFLSEGASLRLTGAIANTGVISLNAAVGSTNGADEPNLVIVGKSSQGVTGGVTLTGGGKIELSDSVENQINGTVLQARSADVLTSNNTIEGAGYIAHLTFNNSGVVDGLYDDHWLSLNDDAITNSGVLESSGFDGLYLYNGTVVTNVGGGKITSGVGDYVWIADATIANGTLSGGFNIVGPAVFEGASLLTVGAGSTVYIDEQTLTLEGAIANNGLLFVGTSPAGIGEIAIAGLVLLGGPATFRSTAPSSTTARRRRCST